MRFGVSWSTPKIVNPLPWTTGFGGEDQIVTPATLLQPGPNILFGPTLRFRFGRNRVELCGINEIHATFITGIAELLVGLGFSILFTPGHGAETDRGHINAGVSERAFFNHGSLLQNDWVTLLSIHSPQGFI